MQPCTAVLPNKQAYRPASNMKHHAAHEFKQNVAIWRNTLLLLKCDPPLWSIKQCRPTVNTLPKRTVPCTTTKSSMLLRKPTFYFYGYLSLQWNIAICSSTQGRHLGSCIGIMLNSAYITLYHNKHKFKCRDHCFWPGRHRLSRYLRCALSAP